MHFGLNIYIGGADYIFTAFRLGVHICCIQQNLGIDNNRCNISGSG